MNLNLSANTERPVMAAYLFRVGSIHLLVFHFLAVTTAQAAPSGILNDTGLTRCLNTTGTALEACSEANSGDASTRPRQDGRFGRDMGAGNTGISGLAKPAGSGGSGGFAFTPLDVDGNPIALTGNPPVPSSTPRCIKDNVTNLIWEVKTTDGIQGVNNTVTWFGAPLYVDQINALNLCGETANDWRMPTLPELLSIVDHDRAIGPVIDPNYFPNTASAYYWTGTQMSNPSNFAWFVKFEDGDVGGYEKTSAYGLRLVRSGP